MTTIDPANEPAPAPPAAPNVEPWAWSPTVGGWADHREQGRVLVTAHDANDAVLPWVVMRPTLHGDESLLPRTWCATADLTPPAPRVWKRTEGIPAHVVVRDREQRPFAGAELHIGHDYRGPFTEVLPEAGVW